MHTYRKMAFRPRINCAYDALTNDNKLRVSSIVCEELVQKGLEEKLNVALAQVGWQTDEGHLSTKSETVRELLFPPSTQHDAYSVATCNLFSLNTESNPPALPKVPDYG